MAKVAGGFNPKRAAKKSGNIYAGLEIKTEEFINTGSLSLNAILSGSLFGGCPNNQIMMYAGEESVGKTYIMLRQAYMMKQQGYFVYYFDSEGAVHDGMFEMYGFSSDEYEILPVPTVEELRIQMFSIASEYEEYYKTLKRGTDEYKNRTKITFFLDSLGNLSSEKSLDDTSKGKSTRVMSKQQEIKRLFLDLTVKLNTNGIPFLMTNHVYEQIGAWIPTKTVSGGSGGKYNASNIMMLRKKDVKDEKTKQFIGSVITVKAKKSRFVKPNLEIEFYLDYKRGLMPLYGLGKIAELSGLIKKVKVGTSNHFLIQDPRKPKEEWISVPCAQIDRKDAIGTILEPLDEWVKENFLLKTDLSDIEDDAELDLDKVEIISGENDTDVFDDDDDE